MKSHEMAREWNRDFPIGTPVMYYVQNDANTRTGRTRGRAVLKEGEAVVMVEGCDVPVPLSNVRTFVLSLTDEQEVQEVIRLRDQLTDVTITMPAPVAMAVVGCLQLALRHPLMVGPAGKAARETAEAIQRKFPPEVCKMLNRGWNNMFDSKAVPVDPFEGR